MKNGLLGALALIVFLAEIGLAGEVSKRNKFPNEAPLIDLPVPDVPPKHDRPEPDWSILRPAVGTYTTLSGYYDYQSNGGSVHYIRVNPATGNIHVTYMMRVDSADAATSATRRTMYAFSTDGGASWDNFFSAYVPNRRSGFPSIDLARGAIAGSPIIANHSIVASVQRTSVMIDSPEGTGAFTELSPLPLLDPAIEGGEPIWPYVAGASDGSIIFAASVNHPSNPNTPGVNVHNRTEDYNTWLSPWRGYPGQNQSGGRYPVVANDNGRVGIQLNTSNGTANTAIYWLESTDNGVTWPTSSTQIYGLTRVTETETLKAYVHSDAVYRNNEPVMAFTEFNAQAGVPSYPRITFWSQSTGFRYAAPWDSTLYIPDINVPNGIIQRFHNFSVGWPSIGLSGDAIAVVYQAFQAETSAIGFNYSDIWMVKSDDGGMTWSFPVNLTNTPNMDERYPSVSKWNAPGEVNIVWQEDPVPGAHAFADGAPISRSSLVFLKATLTGVAENGGTVRDYRLYQNYPNPFNPTTKILYSIGRAADVSLKVYNVIGQVVAVLVDEHRSAGTYEVGFDGSHLPSGVYFYRLSAGSFAGGGKMLLLK
jgi:hypothetical protein